MGKDKGQVIKTLFTHNEIASLGHLPNLCDQSDHIFLKWRAVLTSQTITGGGAITLLTSRTAPADDPFEDVIEWYHSACGYCSFGCGLEIGIDINGHAVAARGNGKHPINAGHLCLYGHKTLTNEDLLIEEHKKPIQPPLAELSH